jgi:hypothetical protein
MSGFSFVCNLITKVWKLVTVSWNSEPSLEFDGIFRLSILTPKFPRGSFWNIQKCVFDFGKFRNSLVGNSNQEAMWNGKHSHLIIGTLFILIKDREQDWFLFLF